jgi:hypothetical protein
MPVPPPVTSTDSPLTAADAVIVDAPSDMSGPQWVIGKIFQQRLDNF